MPLVEQELLSLPEGMSSASVFSEVRVARSLIFCVVFCRSLFVLLYLFFWPLCYLFFELQRLLIALLVSLDFSYIVACYNVSIFCIYVTEYLFCILIVGSPDVTLMSTYTVLYGNDITMSCIITAVPNITRFKWQTDISGVFDDINTDSSHYFGATLSNHSLTVVNVKFPDAGRYKCIGTNFVGTGSDITTLVVDGGKLLFGIS